MPGCGQQKFDIQAPFASQGQVFAARRWLAARVQCSIAEMLRIINTGTASEQRWTVCGQLTGPWVAELRSNWELARLESEGRKCIVDISDVTFIDGEGEELLRAMKAGGARFVARGIDTKHLLDNLKTRGQRPLRRFLSHRTDGCGHP